jgi:hypothetical protein
MSSPTGEASFLLSYKLCKSLTNNLLVHEICGCHSYADKNWNNVGYDTMSAGTIHQSTQCHI